MIPYCHWSFQRFSSYVKFNPSRGMIAGLLPPPHVSVDSRFFQARGGEGIEKQVIDAQTRVASIRISKIIPERIDAFAGMEGANRIGPALRQQPMIGRSRLGSE